MRSPRPGRREPGRSVRQGWSGPPSHGCVRATYRDEMTAPDTPIAADALDVPIARLDGTPTTLREIVGPNAALVVNVASRCGLTPQYGALERLQERYGDAGLTVG